MPTALNGLQVRRARDKALLNSGKVLQQLLCAVEERGTIDLWMTTATGKGWHNERDCTRAKEMRKLSSREMMADLKQS